MYWSVGGFVTCCGCILATGEDPVFTKFSDATEHLYEHRAAGHYIAQYAFDGLSEDAAKYGDFVPADQEDDDRA